MDIHKLKINKKYAEAILDGSKTFEIRRADRDYKAGDVLHLIYLEGEKIQVIEAKVTYILENFVGIKSGYLCMSLGEVHFIGEPELQPYGEH